MLSETAACRTVAEGVALVEAAERSGGVYMFAENYPYMPFTREMRRRYAAGDIGEVRYAEAEYLDEPADLAAMVNDRAHWRARTPATYHCTHSLAPVAARTSTSASSCRSPGSRRCAPAWPGACLSRFLTCAAPTFAEPARLTIGFPSCRSFSQPQRRPLGEWCGRAGWCASRV